MTQKAENPRHEHPTEQFSRMGWRVQAVLLVNNFVPAPKAAVSHLLPQGGPLCYTVN